MNTQTCISISEARKRIFQISDEIQTPGNFYTLTEKGKPKVVLISAEEFESWQETIETMRELPNLKKDVQKAEKEYKNKDYVTLEEYLAEEGFVRKSKKK